MADFSSSRRSSNILDFRGKPKQQQAYNLGVQVQKALDNAFIKLGKEELDASPEARKRASQLRSEIDSVGTKGKGRAGSGSRQIERILKAHERRKWAF
ncbi:MAG: hypothetical protein E6Q97_22745 [Desulfurellales bacterium]|nr:MAG: hypothetical protein E6Q97_22745 [Desulfurellales bacterium]